MKVGIEPQKEKNKDASTMPFVFFKQYVNAGLVCWPNFCSSRKTKCNPGGCRFFSVMWHFNELLYWMAGLASKGNLILHPVQLFFSKKTTVLTATETWGATIGSNSKKRALCDFFALIQILIFKGVPQKKYRVFEEGELKLEVLNANHCMGF